MQSALSAGAPPSSAEVTPESQAMSMRIARLVGSPSTLRDRMRAFDIQRPK